MEALFQYVLSQFYAVYQPDQPFEINYGLNKTSRIQIKSTNLLFFENTEPYPEAPPVYYTWKNQNIPFWFQESVTGDIIQFTEDKAIIQVDIMANAFYFLSGWQEYYSTGRDTYGRFPYAESLQKRYEFITIPLVNYYFDILKTAIERVYQLELKSILARQSLFTTCLTHDIDNCQSAWMVEGLKAWEQQQWRDLGGLLKQKLLGRDNWFNVPEVMRTVQGYGVNSTFFFLANNQKYKGIANADYDIAKPRYQAWLPLLQKSKFEIGLHGSHITALIAGKLQAERQKIPTQINGNRFHYLRFDPQRTPELLDQAAIAYDSTLGFSEHYGFRHGTCFPFRLFNFKNRQTFRFWEMPLHVMDATLHHPRYLQLKTEEILPAITPMLQEIKKFGGCFTWLWHNENFSRFNTMTGPAAFHQIMDYLKKQNAGFKTLGEVHDWLKTQGE